MQSRCHIIDEVVPIVYTKKHQTVMDIEFDLVIIRLAIGYDVSHLFGTRQLKLRTPDQRDLRSTDSSTKRGRGLEGSFLLSLVDKCVFHERDEGQGPRARQVFPSLFPPITAALS